MDNVPTNAHVLVADLEEQVARPGTPVTVQVRLVCAGQQRWVHGTAVEWTPWLTRVRYDGGDWWFRAADVRAAMAA